MGVDEPEFVELANQIEELEQKLFTHPLHKVSEKCPSSPFLLLLTFGSVFWFSHLSNATITLLPSILIVCCLHYVAVQSQDVHQISSFQKKAEVNHEIQQLKSKMRDSQVLLSWCLIPALDLLASYS